VNEAAVLRVRRFFFGENMRSITDYEPPRQEIRFKARDEEYGFTIHGLTLDDLSFLIGEHLNDMEAAHELFQDMKGNVGPGKLDAFVLNMVRSAPGLVAEVISVAAHMRGSASVFAKIPFATSSFALLTIVQLTFEEQGGLKNLLAVLQKLANEMLPASVLEQVGPRLKALTPADPLSDSTGASEPT
jgi:hypothetical protein